MLQRDNTGSLVATQSLVREHDLGLFFTTMDDLGVPLRQHARMAALRANVWRKRRDFTFDAHADRLLAFFRQVLAK